MASPKSKTDLRTSSGRQGECYGEIYGDDGFFVGAGASVPKGATGFKFQVPDNAYKAFTGKADRMKALLQQYGEAIVRSRIAGRSVSFRVDIDPAGATTMTPVEEVAPAQAHLPEEAGAPDAELQDALAVARKRGRLLAADKTLVLTTCSALTHSPNWSVRCA